MLGCVVLERFQEFKQHGIAGFGTDWQRSEVSYDSCKDECVEGLTGLFL